MFFNSYSRFKQSPSTYLSSLPLCPICQRDLILINSISLHSKTLQPLIQFTCSCSPSSSTIPIQKYFNFLSQAVTNGTSLKCFKHPNRNGNILCIDCNLNMCSNCYSYHNSFEPSHRAKFATGYNDIKCNKHNVICNDYCCDCDEYTCSECKKGHSDHNGITLNEYWDSINNNLRVKTSEDINRLMNRSKEHLDGISHSHIDKIDQMIKRLIRMKENIKERCDMINKVNEQMFHLYLLCLNNFKNSKMSPKINILHNMEKVVINIEEDTTMQRELKINEITHTIAKKIVDMEQFIGDSYYKMIVFDLDCFNDNLNKDLLQKKRKKSMSSDSDSDEEVEREVLNLIKMSKMNSYASNGYYPSIISKKSSVTLYSKCINEFILGTVIPNAFTILSSKLINPPIIIAGTNDCKIMAIELKSGKQINTYDLVNKTVSTISSTVEDNSTVENVFIALSDNSIRSFNPISFSFTQNEYRGHTQTITAMIVIPLASSFISSSKDGTIRAWEITSCQCLSVYKGHLVEVNCLLMFNYDSIFISGGGDATVKVWTLNSETFIMDLRGHQKGVISLCKGKNDKENIVFSSGLDLISKIWDIKLQICLATITSITSEVITSVWIDGYVVTGESNGFIKLWEDEAFECEECINTKLKRAIKKLIKIDNDNKIVSLSDGGFIKIWKR